MSGRDRNATSEGRGGLPVSPKTIASGLLVLVLVLFVVLNRNETEVSFIVFSAEVALWVALTVAGVIGLAAGFLLGRRRYRR